MYEEQFRPSASTQCSVLGLTLVSTNRRWFIAYSPNICLFEDTTS